MSLFNDLQWEIIENPKQKWSYHRILKAKEKEIKSKKEIAKEMKEKMWEEAYRDWYQKEYYKNRRKEIKKKYQEKKKEEELFVWELIDEIYADVPEIINRDKYYTQKFRDDDINYEGKFKFSRRVSRLNWVKPSKEEAYIKPVMVYNFANLWWVLTNLWRIQDRAYEYLKPHINEISLGDLKLSKRQSLTKNPMRATWWNMRKLVDNTDISMNQVCSVASAMLRDKYIISEVYLGRVSFLVGDVIISQAGNIYRPCLENNIPWLTKDTVDELHKKRMDWLKKKTDDLKIYILWDTYLVKYQPNEREKWFYIIPT